MGVYEIENLINLTLPRQRNLQFLKTAFILNGVQPGEAHVYPIFLLYTVLILKKIHTWDGTRCFSMTTHSPQNEDR